MMENVEEGYMTFGGKEHLGHPHPYIRASTSADSKFGPSNAHERAQARPRAVTGDTSNLLLCIWIPHI